MERLAQNTETGGAVTLIVIFFSTMMKWFNENHLAVISIVTIITGIVTVVAAIYRHKLNKRRIDLYEKEVHAKLRRKEDKQ